MSPDPSNTNYWRSLEHLAESPEIQAAVEAEFPGYDGQALASTSRRSFLKLMAASLAMAGIGLTGCRRVPQNKLAPYAANPRDRIPGVPEQYATQFELNGAAAGLLVTCYDGRPIKIEGNPSHPFSWTEQGRRGAADAFAQASVLDLYDPQRSRTPVERRGKQRVISTWDAFAAFAGPHFGTLRRDGTSLAVLAEPASGPTSADMRRRILETFPGATWYEYDPLSRDAELEGTRLMLGRPFRPVLHLDRAAAVVLLDADVLGAGPGRVRYAADWAARRRSADAADHAMSRVYLAEAGFSLTGSVADVRLPVTPDRFDAIARALAAKLEVPRADPAPQLSEAEMRFVDKAAADLQSAKSAGLVAAGPGAPAEVHALAYLINRHLGSIGTTVTLHVEPDRPSHFAAIAELASRMEAGKVGTLLLLGGNPAYDAPADLQLASRIASVPVSIRLGRYDDETSGVCNWHLPQAHYLEAWGDSRALDGTPGISQPMIEPLFGGKSSIELLALLTGDESTTGEELVRRSWQSVLGEQDFEKRFRTVLEAGALADGIEPAANPRPRRTTVPAIEKPLVRGDGLVLRFEPDSRTHDGRFANNAWLQETPDPLTKLVWENALMLNQQDAAAAGLKTGDWAVLTIAGRVLPVPAFILPGQPAGMMSLSLGYGRTAGGAIASGLGSNANLVRTSGMPYYATGIRLSRGDGSRELATTQNHHIPDAIGRHGMEEKVGQRQKSGEIIREASLAEYQKDPKFAANAGGHVVRLQLFEPPHKFNAPHAWGMSVDLNACIGCNACTVACQSENNIPVVGREQVLVHRQMNWLRVDRYFKGDAANPADVDVVFQPVMCQHCENAPCEQVCPATATVHDTEGLNTMVYNRCIGTRYCSNNCAYKVRRFNYFDFHSKDPRAATATPYAGIPDQQQKEQVDPIRQMAMNPEVTVRMRGVMEKCTYCVQRIHSATVSARTQGEGIVPDGQIQTACQQTCPTQAITFGNLNDPHAEVSKQHNNPRAYELLGELNNRPRTKYLAKLRNREA